MTVRRILVCCLDARLRTRAFDQCAAAGFAVDGVADSDNLAKRLAKDAYAAIVLEAGIDPRADLSPDVPRIDARPADPPELLSDAIAALADRTEPAEPTDPAPPAGPA